MKWGVFEAWRGEGDVAQGGAVTISSEENVAKSLDCDSAMTELLFGLRSTIDNNLWLIANKLSWLTLGLKCHRTSTDIANKFTATIITYAGRRLHSSD